MNFFCIVILIFLNSFKLNPLVDYNDPSSLYDQNDNGVVVLHAGNIRTVLNNSLDPWIVNFYASWCGHCIEFSSKYQDLQRHIPHWGVYFGAVNCANAVNTDICDNKYLIFSYPTIKLFNCMENENDRNSIDMSDLVRSRSVQEMRLAIASFLVNQTKCKTSPHSSYEFSMTLWEAFKNEQTPYNYMVIIIGSFSDTRLIDSLSLDMRVCNKVYVTLLDIKNTNLVSLFGSFPTPSIIVVNRSVHIETISNDLANYSANLIKLYQYLKDECPGLRIIEHLMLAPQTNTSKSVAKIKNASALNEIYLTDIISGISMTLRKEIPRKPFTPSTFQYIKNWLNIIQQCLYWTKDQHEFLENLKEWFISQGDGLTTADWMAFMRSDQAVAAFPENTTWITCKGSNSFYRGFPCSLWLAFHIMTVKCENPPPQSQITYLDVLIATRAYILNFFGCGICRVHFKELTRPMFDKVKSGSDAILFYWLGHNMVNARLKLDDSADPFAPKIQFPPESICQDCRNVDSLNESDIIVITPGYDVSAVRWNKLRTLNFLRSHYGPDNIRRSDKNYTLINEDLYDPSVVSRQLRKILICYTFITIIFFIFFTYQIFREFVTSMHVKRR